MSKCHNLQQFERAFGVPPADQTPFAEPARPTPPEPEGDPKMRRVSNALRAVLKDVERVETSFEYQYGYNRELVAELAREKAEAADMRRELNAQNLDNIELVQEQTDLLAAAARQKSALSTLTFVAVTGWLTAVLPLLVGIWIRAH
jgi:VIT1/CCC1 family predicted Fe2+/Mn2+ transporter